MSEQQTALVSFPINKTRFDVVLPVPPLPRESCEAQVLDMALQQFLNAVPDASLEDRYAAIDGVQVIWPYTITVSGGSDASTE